MSYSCVDERGRFVPKHGYANPNNPTYNSWWAMRQRCEDHKHKSYASYGGRGIKVCAEWKTFTNFLRDVGERPSKAYTLGRIDNSKGYEPGNCRWETITEQQNNRRSCVYLTAFGRSQTISMWSREMSVPADTLRYRLRSGWSIERALTQKVDTRWTKETGATSLAAIASGTKS